MHELAIASDDDAAHLAVTAVEGGVISVLGGVLRRKDTDLAKRTEQLHHAEKMQAFGVFAGGVAHDFNNMLGVVLTCADILERRLPEGHPARGEITEIRQAAGRAAGLTRQLLTFARRREVERQPLDLHEVLARVEPIVRRVVGPFVEVELVLGATRHRVLADAAQLELAIVNLAANARDAMPDGGGLTIRTGDGDGPSGGVELAVIDTGVGMDAATRARAFEPFFTTKGAGQGTGLGLSMVFGIVEAMEGHIAIDSEPGHGATFRVTLPTLS